MRLGGPAHLDSRCAGVRTRVFNPVDFAGWENNQRTVYNGAMENRRPSNAQWLTMRHAISTPFIWSVLFPILLSDICLEIYHRICFPLYGIPYVERSRYIRIVDRYKLPYLTLSERLGCAYCGYVNGWLHYASVIAGKTEHYWCGVAHLEERGYVPAPHEKDFVQYGDEAALRKRYFEVEHNIARS